MPSERIWFSQHVSAGCYRGSLRRHQSNVDQPQHTAFQSSIHVVFLVMMKGANVWEGEKCRVDGHYCRCSERLSKDWSKGEASAFEW